MRLRLLPFLAILCMGISAAIAQVQVQVAFPNLTFSEPIDLQHAGDGSNRLFLVERRGMIKMFMNDRNVATAETFLDITNRVRIEGSEEGLLGVAFHPNFETNGYFYVNYVASEPRRTIIARFTRDANDPNRADPASELRLLEVEQPFANHKAGQLQFGADGYLYIPLGDGGSAGDPMGHGQDRSTLLGSMLRIDVNNPANGLNYGIPADNPYVGNTEGWREETWAYGFRNPFRFSFDPQTGWLWLSDAGQDAIEEINVVHKGGNYGWKIMEGSGCFEPKIRCDSMAEAMGLVTPIYDYTHRLGDVVIGGYVYRGTKMPALAGKYIFSDFNVGSIWALDFNQQDTSAMRVHEVVKLEGERALMISSYGIDQNNELYILSYDGKIYELTGSMTPPNPPITMNLQQAFPQLTFQRPIDFQHANDGSDRLYVVEQPGVIRTFMNSGAVASADIFLDIRDRVRTEHNEEGLLGLAFHPNYTSNGYLYVNYVASNPRRTIIARFTRDANDPNRADPASELRLMEVEQPFGNHNAGQIRFGPDGYLYIPLGDGGDAGDPMGHGQNLQTLLGSMLRIDVNNPANALNYGIPADNPYRNNTLGWREETWAHGFRNPFRFSFDSQTGWLWMPDVGQDAIEEVNVIRKGGNYGWDIMEGSGCFEPKIRCDSMADAMGLVKPIFDYTHRLGETVIGGMVYRGTMHPALVGKYIFADFISGRIWALDFNQQDTTVMMVHEIMHGDAMITSFGTDRNNEIYMLTIDGKIHTFQSLVGSVGSSESPVAATMAAYPNPFRGEARLTYSLAVPAQVELQVYDMRGVHVRTLHAGQKESGVHDAMWDGRATDGSALPAGAYICRLRADGRAAAAMRVMLER